VFTPSPCRRRGIDCGSGTRPGPPRHRLANCDFCCSTVGTQAVPPFRPWADTPASRCTCADGEGVVPHRAAPDKGTPSSARREYDTQRDSVHRTEYLSRPAFVHLTPQTLGSETGPDNSRRPTRKLLYYTVAKTIVILTGGEIVRTQRGHPCGGAGRPTFEGWDCVWCSRAGAVSSKGRFISGILARARYPGSCRAASDHRPRADEPVQDGRRGRECSRTRRPGISTR